MRGMGEIAAIEKTMVIKEKAVIAVRGYRFSISKKYPNSALKSACMV